MLKNSFKILGLIFCFNTLNAQDFSLAQATEFALKNHFQSVNAQLDVNKAKKVIQETRAMGLPQVNGGFDYLNNLKLLFPINIPAVIPPGQEFMLMFGAKHKSTAQVTASQLVFDGSYIVALQASKAYLEMYQNQKVKTEADIKSNIAKAYYLALVAQENTNIQQKALNNLSTSIKETEAMFKEGFVEETDVSQLQLTQLNLNSSLENAKFQKDIAYQMLKFTMGMDLKSDIKLSDNLQGVISQINLESLLTEDFNLNGNPDFVLLNSQAKLLQLDLKRYKMQRLPTIAAFYQGQATAYQVDFDFYKDAKWLNGHVAGLSIKIPIWSSGMQAAKIGQAKIEIEKIKNTTNSVNQGLQVQFTNSKNNLSVKMSGYKNAKKGLELAEKIQNNTRIKQKEGLASSFEASQIDNQLLSAQGNYIQSLFDLLNAKSELDKLQNK